jgi:hypothetical protein
LCLLRPGRESDGGSFFFDGDERFRLLDRSFIDHDEDDGGEKGVL